MKDRDSIQLAHELNDTTSHGFLNLVGRRQSASAEIICFKSHPIDVLLTSNKQIPIVKEGPLQKKFLIKSFNLHLFVLVQTKFSARILGAFGLVIVKCALNELIFSFIDLSFKTNLTKGIVLYPHWLNTCEVSQAQSIQQLEVSTFLLINTTIISDLLALTILNLLLLMVSDVLAFSQFLNLLAILFVLLLLNLHGQHQILINYFLLSFVMSYHFIPKLVLDLLGHFQVVLFLRIAANAVHVSLINFSDYLICHFLVIDGSRLAVRQAGCKRGIERFLINHLFFFSSI